MNLAFAGGVKDYGFAGAGEFAVAACGADGGGLKSVHLMTMRTGICWPFISAVSSERA